MPEPVYTCGIERSSSGASVLVLDVNSGRVVYRDSFTYDAEFGNKYPIENGVLRSDTGERHVPQVMLLDALELVFERMKRETGANIIPHIMVYKLDDMQHALAYTHGLRFALSGMNPQRTLADNLGHCFTRDTTHIWEDRTTQAEVDYLDEQLEQYGGMAALTGNPAEHRFPAAQLLRWIRAKPEEYQRTDLIQPLSAFGTSVLAGRVAPVDTGDGWGTNLNTININNPGWDYRITDIVDRKLHQRLCGMTHYDSRIGHISGNFVQRFGANQRAYVLAGTGDNPAYLLGFFISTGTSWTVNGELPEVTISNGEDNVFGCKPGGAMSLVCFTNGGRLHRQFRETYADDSWERYHELAGQAEPASNLMLPYILTESVPRRPAGIVRDGFDESDGPKNVRALYDSQVLSARRHSEHMALPPVIWVVAGGGKSPVLRQTIADVFDHPVQTLEESDFAAVLGDAIAGAADILKIPYGVAVREFAKPLPGSRTEPNPKNVPKYREALPRYAELESRAA